MKRKILLASGNKDKLAELQALCDKTNIVALSARDFAVNFPEENGQSLEENAIIKARAAFSQTGIESMADDTGLFVRALGEKPGIHTARYGGPSGNYQDNIDKLLRELGNNEDRFAVFRTAIAFCDKNREIALFHGQIEGEILRERRGDLGFGYDPVFFLPKLKRTFAELNGSLKNQYSHRGQALKKFIDFIRGTNITG